MIPNERFLELLKDIEPSPSTKSRASAAHTGVRNHLWGEPGFKAWMIHDFLTGSYFRDTALRPQTIDGEIERPDVDVAIVTNHTQSDAPDDVLNALSKSLRKEFHVERINKRSVHLITPGAVMDVVPLICNGTAFLIPDRDTQGWLHTNPPYHSGWSEDQNKKFGGRFTRTVKLVKWWRRHNWTGKRPKGFANEVLVAMHAPSAVSHYGEAFAQFLENIAATYGQGADANIKPFIPDPAFPATNDVLSKCTIPQWKAFIDKVRIHAEFARRAQTTSDLDEATRLWKRIFGERFKSTEASARTSSSYGYASAAAPVGLSFPAANAAPNTPREFA